MKLSCLSKFIILVVGILGPTLASGAAQVPPSAPVTVVNTPSNPVPVTGSTTVSGSVSISGTVPVTQSGTWNVGVGGTVDNRDLDEHGRIAYQAVTSSFIGLDPTLPPVPAGKRLVIENVNVQTISPNIVGGYVRMTSFNTFDFAFPMTFVGNRPGVGNFAVGNFPVKAYVDPSTNPVQFLSTNGFGTISSITVVVSGYLLDCSVAQCAPVAH